MKEKKKVYALEAPVQEFFLEEPSSFPKKTFDFIILYTPGLLDNFSPAQKKYIELLFQSHFIGYRDVKVIANNPFTASINNLTNDDKKPEVDYSMGDVTKSNLIWVSVSDLKHISKRSKGFLGLEVTGGNEFYRKFALAELSTKINGKEYKYLMEIVTDKIDGFEMVLTRSLDLKEIDDNIFINVGKIHGFVESDNKKEPFVLFESSLPYSKVKEFEVFNTTDINKKTKPIGKIKKETFLNPYLALCKIDEGKKEIMPLIEGKKELYLMGKEPKALFGLDATSVFKSDLKYYIIK